MTTFETHYLEPAQPLRLRSGEDHSLEEQAHLLLAKSRQGVTALSEKRDWLSDDQLQLRYQREVMNHNGIADERLFSGMFRRAYADRDPRPTRHSPFHDEY